METMPLLNLQLLPSRNKESNVIAMKTFDYKSISRQISTASKETSSLSPSKTIPKKKMLKLNITDKSKFTLQKRNTLIINTKESSYKTPEPISRSKNYLYSSVVNKNIETVSLPKINEPHMIETENLLDISFGLESPRREFHKMQTYAMKPKKIKIITDQTSSNNIVNLMSDYSNSPDKRNKEFYSSNTLSNKTKLMFHHHHNKKSKSKYIKITSSTQVSTSPSHYQNYPKYYPSKVSSHAIGKYIKSYAVNSYQGINTQYNEDKISIILSISKPKDFKGLWPSCSFIALYDGNGGSKCCDFLRDHLHQYIIKNPFFPQDPEKAIVTGFDKANSHYIEHISEKENNSSVSSALVILIINEKLFVANCGVSQAIASLNRGEIHKDLFSDTANDNMNLFGSSKMKIYTKQLKLDNSIDFILLGTNSISDKVSAKEMVSFIWDKLNNPAKKYGSLHSLSGDAVDSIMKTALERKATENISCVLICFNSIDEAFNKRKNVIEGYSYKKRECKTVSNI